MDVRTGGAVYGAAELGLGITTGLARFLSEIEFDALPEGVVHAARRGVLDWLGCALAGSRYTTLEKLVGVLSVLAPGPVPMMGQSMRLAPLEAAMVNGQSGHVLDFDDTHMGGVVLHASSPILGALLSLAAIRPLDGRTFVCAYVAGFEAGVRAGQGAPGHHAGGWHLTGTLGSIAAAAATGRALGLDARRETFALGIGATQAAGLQQNRGTMCKSFHAGKSAANGLLAGLLAERDFDSSDEILEGKRGFCGVYSDVAIPDVILDELGTRWEILRNGFKPYACGIVLHPAIDAMIEASRRAPAGADVERIELRVHPHAISITGVADPKTGLRSKFSLAHSAAVSFLDRAAGIAQYSDARAQDSEVVALRERVSVATDPALRKDQAHVRILFGSGEIVEHEAAHATGTVDNPMSDAAVEAKFLANAEPVIGAAAAELAQMVWQLDEVPDITALLDLASLREGR